MKRSPEYCKANDKVTEMNTLTGCTSKAFKNGYTENFRVVDGHIVTGDGLPYCPQEIRVVNYYRFEGESDPADNVILYIIETTDGVKGTLVNAMGVYADGNIGDFMKEVEGMYKKNPK